ARGGKGVMGMSTKDEDFVKHLMTACSHDYVLFFTNKGRMHWIKGYDIPEGARTGKGKNIVNLLEFEEGESVRAMITVDNLDVEDRYIMMATKKGVVKKTELRAFRHLRKKPIKAIVLDEEDDLIEAKLTDGTNEVLLSTAGGIACRFLETDVRSMGRVSRGVRGIRLGEENQVVSMIVVTPDMDILVVTNQGMGKRSAVENYRLTKRGAKGVISIKLKEGDKVVEALRVVEGDEMIMTTMQGQMVRIETDPIRPIGRASQGVKILSLKKKGDFIISVSRVMKVEGAEDEESEETEGEENAEGATAPEASAEGSEAPESTSEESSDSSEESDES
ncbi:MAG: DNA gyrase subunit A, partial [Lentisphaeraceae bacterium]|nr:DNA gyrase subunit A [Lentisphaeraceae bacterium]